MNPFLARAVSTPSNEGDWGVYDDRRVYPSVEVLKIPTLTRESISVPFVLQSAAKALGTPAAPNVSDLVQYSRVPATLTQMTFDTKTEDQAADLSTALLGIAFYANGDPVRAKELLDRGLKRLDPAKAMSLDWTKQIFNAPAFHTVWDNSPTP